MAGDMTLLIVLAIVALALVGLLFWVREKNRQRLKTHFGPEYEEAVHRYGSTEKAESALSERERRRADYHIVQLASRQRSEFERSWVDVQANFVDSPRDAVAQADTLVSRVMEARGYPMADFDRRAEDLSVDHPHVIRNYREAHRIAQADSSGHASTEDLRQAMVHYRELFAELLEPIVVTERTR